jgi:hypothetical protein
MRLLLLSFAALAILPGLVWPSGAVSIPKALRGEISSRDPFGDFLGELRLSEDTLQYRLGQLALDRQRYDSALGHNLAADLPATGSFRDTLLAQRSRIFARIWPVNAPRAGGMGTLAKDTVSETPKAVFDWGMGTSHSRGMFRSGQWQPDGWQGMGYEDNYWMYNTYARQSWPLSIRGQALQLAMSLNQATAAEFSILDAALSAEVQGGILENLSLVLSGGLRKSQLWGIYRSYDVQISKAWYFESMGMGLEAGISREWDAGGRRLNDQAWITLERNTEFENGNTFGLSLKGAAEWMDSQYDGTTASVLYVDDVSKVQPTHFRTADDGDTLFQNTGYVFTQDAGNTGTLQLAMTAPRSYFSLRPALHYGFSLPRGFGATAGARYSLDLYPESAWDWVPMPDSMDLSEAELVGLAYNRADGRYYSVAVAEENGVLQESYGTVPLQKRKAKRMDQRAGLEFSLWRALPHGYTFALETSAVFGWSNLSGTSPIDSQPWQFGLTFNLSRSASW